MVLPWRDGIIIPVLLANTVVHRWVVSSIHGTRNKTSHVATIQYLHIRQQQLHFSDLTFSRYQHVPNIRNNVEQVQIESLETMDDLANCLQNLGMAPGHISSVLQVIPNCKRTQVNFHQLVSLISLLQTMDIGADHIPALVRAAPFMYQRNPSLHLQPKIVYLETLGLNRKDLCRLILKHPYSLHRPLECIQEQIQYLRSLPLDDEELQRVIQKYPLAFRLVAKRQLQPRLEFLKSLGVFHADIKKALLKNSTILTKTPKSLQKTVDFLLSLGFKSGTAPFSKAFRYCGSRKHESLHIVLKALSDIGFTCDEIKMLVVRDPLVLTRNRESILEKVKYLVEIMKRLPGELLLCPVFLQLSLDNRIKPRHEAFVRWKAENQVEKDYSLSYIFLPNDKAFYRQFPGIQLNIVL